MDLVRNLASSDQADDDARTDDEGQHEPVDGIPARCPAPVCRARVDIIEKVEGEELGDERVFYGQEHRRPGHCGCHHSNGITPVALGTTELGPL